MIIRIRDANFSVLEEASTLEFESIRRMLSYKEPMFVRGRYVVNTKYMIHKKTRVFPTGLIPLVTTAFDTIIVNECKVPEIKVHGETLTEYQKHVVNEALSYKRAIISIPTGAGKTYTFSRVAHEINLKTVIIVPTQEIYDQVVSNLQKFGTEYGEIWRNRDDGFSKKVTITTAGTLNARFDFLKEEAKQVEMLIADEAHFYGADVFFRVSHLFPNAHYRLGFSGTPIGRSDNADIRTLAVFSPYIITYDGPIDRVVPVTVLLVEYEADLFANHTDYNSLLEDSGRINAIRKVVEYMRKEQITPYLIFTDRVSYGRTLQEVLGLPFISSTSIERDTIFEEMRKGNVEGAITTIGWIGLDIPNLKAIVNTSRETTLISLGQKAGRVSRKQEDKSVGIVIDFNDTCGRLPRRWSRKRRQTYQRLGFTVIDVTV